MADLFKPVSSTKGKGHAGLGLSIVKNLVGELKGRIFCQSNEISGTAFQVLLPLKAMVVLKDR
jgi:nitrogen-specific signal transduction histidine kinase